MSKKYFGNGNAKKINELLSNSTILQRISSKSILSVLSEILPQLKDKIHENFSKLSKLNKKNVLRKSGSLIMAATALITSTGCSTHPQKTEESSSYSFSQYDELKNLEKSIIENLGYNPEEVTIILGRDGYFLAYTEKVEEGVCISSNGTVSERVKLRDTEGNIVSIPYNDQEALRKALAYANLDIKDDIEPEGR